mmetsp:Transcript_77392/g.218850  ORF Transcript_77392/g.218850 Transcript_77392/m.218850 type:complete len:164 (-) Transcript_77392:37-528(-)
MPQIHRRATTASRRRPHVEGFRRFRRASVALIAAADDFAGACVGGACAAGAALGAACAGATLGEALAGAALGEACAGATLGEALAGATLGEACAGACAAGLEPGGFAAAGLGAPVGIAPMNSSTLRSCFGTSEQYVAHALAALLIQADPDEVGKSASFASLTK